MTLKLDNLFLRPHSSGPLKTSSKSVVIPIITRPSQSTTTQKVIVTYMPSTHKWTLALRGTTSEETLEVDKEHI